MKLTTKSEYSLLALIYMTRKYPDQYVKVDEICEYYEISKKYLENLLAILKSNRFIYAKRGPSGGYKLNKPPDNISLADIIRLMDGALAPSESVSTFFYNETPINKEKSVILLLTDIRNYISDKMEKTSLRDLI